ncbi:MAG: hypothetical protein HYU88_08950, partial [Chloroflexi bacterium]|nr:hypothetical protein [Chloroflexota bacterium]
MEGRPARVHLGAGAFLALAVADEQRDERAALPGADPHLGLDRLPAGAEDRLAIEVLDRQGLGGGRGLECERQLARSRRREELAGIR